VQIKYRYTGNVIGRAEEIIKPEKIIFRPQVLSPELILELSHSYSGSFNG